MSAEHDAIPVGGPTHHRHGDAETESAGRRRARIRAAVAPALNLLLFGAGLWAVDRVLREYSYGEVVHALAALPPLAVALSLVLSVLGYLSLVGYDWVAFRVIGRPLPFRTMLVPSFVTFAVGNSAPATVLTAGGLRYRLYADRGLGAAEASAVAGVNVVTYALGLCGLAGLALLAHPVAGPAARRLPGATLGLLLLAPVLNYLLAARFRRTPLRLSGRELRFPRIHLATQQLLVSSLDWVLSSGALYVLIAAAAPVSYLDFMATFFLAQAATLVLPIPGGIGVFEAIVLLLRPSDAAAPVVLAALLTYRAIYFLLPLLCAGALLAAQGVSRLRKELHPWAALRARLAAGAPLLLSLMTFVSGALLLIRGAIPTDERRLAWLGEVLPLAVIESSHFLASVVGAALVILAWGLERRIRLAYQLVRVLFVAGILLSLARSLDLQLALLFAVVLVLLGAAARHFPRVAPLSREPLPWMWVFAIASVWIATLWLGMAIHPGVELTEPVWWRFTLYGDAPRFLRAAVGMSVVALLFLFARLLALRAPPPQAPPREPQRQAGSGGA
jgi:phosphatidylglycerol lysyltransferase